jgi:GNAT superfamily N-acetyltransferase
VTGWPPRPVWAALPADIAPLTFVWHQAWHDAHAAITPPTLVARRTPASFAARLGTVDDRLRVVGPDGAPLGLCIIDGDEIDQLYVARAARGTGLAATLLRDAEARLRAAGITEACLDCAAGNDRAARFYTREGWQRVGQASVAAHATDPPILINVILFRKRLGPDGAGQ